MCCNHPRDRTFLSHAIRGALGLLLDDQHQKVKEACFRHTGTCDVLCVIAAMRSGGVLIGACVPFLVVSGRLISEMNVTSAAPYIRASTVGPPKSAKKQSIQGLKEGGGTLASSCCNIESEDSGPSYAATYSFLASAAAWRVSNEGTTCH